MDIAYTLAGLLVGFVVGLTGVGGGSLMTPILVLGFGVKPVIAVGTDLLYAALTKCGGIWVHHRHGTVHWHTVGWLALGSLPSSALTVGLLKYFDAQGLSYEGLITFTLGIALILTSLVLLSKRSLLALSRNERSHFIHTAHTRLRTPLTVLAGVVIGILVTLSSVGAGALGTAVLFFLYPRMAAIRIVGTDLAHAVPLTAIAGIGHMHLGTVDFPLLGSLLLGSLPGIYLGSHLGIRLPEKIIRPVLASMLLMIGLRFAL